MMSSAKEIDLLVRTAYESDAQGFICVHVYECEHHLMVTHELFVSPCVDINFEGIKYTLIELDPFIDEDDVRFIPLSMIESGEWDDTVYYDIDYRTRFIVVVFDYKEN